jgi:hypothetical protein
MTMNKTYLTIVLLLMLVLPCVSIGIEYSVAANQLSFISLVGKWFVFWSIGVRLFSAGIRQVAKPSFTAETIFHITNKESYVIVKELGFANICLGTIGIISLFIPDWRMASAFSGGLFMGIAGINHIIKKPEGINELIAMISDVSIAIIMMFYIILHN